MYSLRRRLERKVQGKNGITAESAGDSSNCRVGRRQLQNILTLDAHFELASPVPGRQPFCSGDRAVRKIVKFESSANASFDQPKTDNAIATWGVNDSRFARSQLAKGFGNLAGTLLSWVAIIPPEAYEIEHAALVSSIRFRKQRGS